MSSCKVSSYESIPVDSLVAELSIFLPKVGQPIAVAAMMRSIMTVVDRSKILEYDVHQDYFEGVTGYPIELPDCATVTRVESVMVNGSPVEFVLKGGNWIEISKSTSSPQLVACPTATSDSGVNGEVVAHVYAGISKDSCDIPVYIYERYGQVIINGALSILYGMQDEDWFDPDLVKFYGGISKGGVDQIKQDVLEQEIPDGIPLESGGLIV